jgi:hypothetical protein
MVESEDSRERRRRDRIKHNEKTGSKIKIAEIAGQEEIKI